VAVDMLIAVAGDELTISVVDFEANVIWKSEILASTIVGLAWYNSFLVSLLRN
jgi:hypothetical protein